MESSCAKEHAYTNEPLVIGIDVGGTNTDAVAFCGQTVLAAAKVPTCHDDYASSVVQVLGLLLEQQLDQVAAVFVGTTAFVNALAEGRALDLIAIVRLCGPSARAIAPLQDFPPSLAAVVSVGTWFAAGGLYFDGQRQELALNQDELAKIALQIASSGAKAVVVSGTFSPCNSQQEEQAAQVLRQHLPDKIRVVISSQSGGRLGLLARENAACLDATLFGTAQRVAFSIQRALLDTGLPPTTQFFFTANDGSVIGFDQAAKSPLRCVACGPTNSIRGAAFLAGSFPKESMVCDRIVLDVGGTTTDAGCLVGGIHPRRANAEAAIAGVRCNQRTTDVVTIALGGGSIVSSLDNGMISIGPESVGADITAKAICFGGSICTATCIAVAMGVDMVFASNVTSYSKATPTRDVSLVEPDVVKKAWDTLQRTFLDLVERTRTDARPIQVLVVGGAAGLVDSNRLAKSLGPDCQVICPEKWASVANACGSALAQAAGEVEAIADLSEQRRDAVLNDLKAKACNRAGHNAIVTECEEVPLAYLPGKISRVYVRAVAPLDLSRNSTAQRDDRKQAEANVSSILETPPALRLSDPPPVSPSPPNVKDGVWNLSEYDAVCLSIGCGILGCGGGGSTKHGLLQLLRALREGQPIRVISANNVPDDALVVPCGYMGAPTVSLERFKSPDCLVAAISRNLSLESDPNVPVLIMLSEVGGSNGLQPLLVGGVMDRPVVDADLMGRAFPELQMTTTAINGCPQMPITASDPFGRCVSLTSPPSGDTDNDLHWVERVLRPVCVEFGCSAGLADPLVRGKDLRRVTVCGSLSRARRIGDCILRSAHPKEAIDRLLEVEGGKLLFEGKVADLQRETSKGFAKGKLTILGENSTSSVVIEFQNEFLIARMVDNGETRMIGCVPDIISLIDVDSAKPIATEEVRFGFRVYVILLPVPQILRTPEALRVVGPKAFGFEESYDSILTDNAGSLLEMSIADMMQ